MQAFTREAVASYMPTVMEAIQAHQAKWDADGHVFAFEEGKSIALDVAMTVLIGLRLDASPSSFPHCCHAYHYAYVGPPLILQAREMTHFQQAGQAIADCSAPRGQCSIRAK